MPKDKPLSTPGSESGAVMSKASILNSVRRALSRTGPLSEAVQQNLSQRRVNWPRPMPELPLTEEFFQGCDRVSASYSVISSPEEFPAAVASYLAAQNYHGEVWLSPEVSQLDFSATKINIQTDFEQRRAPVVVTDCIAAIAENASLLVSSDQVPSDAVFLAEQHLVLLSASKLVGRMEQALAQLPTPPPGAWHFISGPSRTADIEQTIEMGAHGPRALHIIWVASN